MTIDNDLKLSSYSYDLPKSFIADRLVLGRQNSKLLVFDNKTQEVVHDYFYNIDKYLPKESLIVFNQSKVFPCRLIGEKRTGGKVEVFLLDAKANEDGLHRALVKSSGKKRVGDTYFFDNDLELTIKEVLDGTFFLKANIEDLESFLFKYAKVPIPPYIRDGDSDEKDLEDYQTVYAKHTGSVAAPTAGLHFTDEVFQKLGNKDIKQAYVTLHVGLGTFAPVKVDDLTTHKMHTEEYFIEKKDLETIKGEQFVTAVGTTSLRTLESAHRIGLDNFKPSEIYDTDIFLYPGVEVKSINALVTNFHLPESTLLMLVSSLIGREKTLELYEVAKENQYRFFSYGDAMLILR